MSKILEVKDICKTYVVNKRQNNVLRNVSFDVDEGEMVAIMGPSGSGKSTLLYAVSGMDKATGGSVMFEGDDITKMKADYLIRAINEAVDTWNASTWCKEYDKSVSSRKPFT